MMTKSADNSIYLVSLRQPVDTGQSTTDRWTLVSLRWTQSARQLIADQWLCHNDWKPPATHQRHSLTASNNDTSYTVTDSTHHSPVHDTWLVSHDTWVVSHDTWVVTHDTTRESRLMSHESRLMTRESWLTSHVSTHDSRVINHKSQVVTHDSWAVTKKKATNVNFSQDITKRQRNQMHLTYQAWLGHRQLPVTNTSMTINVKYNRI